MTIGKAGYTAAQMQDELNRAMPAAGRAQLGTLLVNLITFAGQVVVDIAAMLLSANTKMLSKAGLVIKAGGGTVVKAGSAFVAMVGGVLVRKAANTDMAALAGTLATAKSAAWAFYIAADGTLSTSAKTADKATHDLALAAVTAAPAGKAMIGVVVIDNATGADFVGGTTALDTASLTVTYYDFMGSVPLGLTQTSASVGALDTR